MLKELGQFSKKIYVKKGQMIYKTGDAINTVYFLQQGLVKLAEDADDGQPVTIVLLQKGELFGFLDRLNNHIEHTQYSVALTDSTLLAFPIEVLLKHLENLSAIESVMLYSMVRQLAEAKQLVYVHSKMTVPERISWFLMKLATMENGVPTINIPLTHEEISFMVGCSRQKVTTYLSKWKKQGIIQYDRGFIQLVDMDKLQ
ncbi:Crp/Fnr family transcriptional regulator [Ureibacillus chungkukjangi]|uniref:CRP-like cAMP-binding protein n=1 Tax=Ureibacillus chungkukjangi TaxID=1202712 RepID=A0A318TJC6_9BACL|nr:Crp/Fnr family transcriptional regulator [Ureibacillus chungkukjangi]MCM3388486.1 Crp/Fnr family transcriptional regulator [Ureibacillus chungkukjangi]PYF03228.1 CRP-like cAMP-binding protein [Ureibacillus chungkukjangi]